jgi:hypothetical protein
MQQREMLNLTMDAPSHYTTLKYENEFTFYDTPGHDLYTFVVCSCPAFLLFVHRYTPSGLQKISARPAERGVLHEQVEMRKFSASLMK